VGQIGTTVNPLVSAVGFSTLSQDGTIWDKNGQFLISIPEILKIEFAGSSSVFHRKTKIG
jgi:hypothetical protein